MDRLSAFDDFSYTVVVVIMIDCYAKGSHQSKQRQSFGCIDNRRSIPPSPLSVVLIGAFFKFKSNEKYISE